MRRDIRHDVYRAISEPTRREILDLLLAGERPVKELVARFDITQPALSQHLRVLRDAGLVTARQEGRTRLYSIDARPLRHVRDWVGHYERFWIQRLDALGKYLEERG